MIIFNCCLLTILLLLTISNASSNDFHLTVRINSTDHSDYCFILPKKRMDIGASENGGNDLVYSFCSKPFQNQHHLPSNQFWYGKGPTIQMKRYKNSKTIRWIQITGCFDPTKFPTLNPGDDGGQYDSNGGVYGQGNPTNSKCEGYASYVELVEPSSNQICLRCCHRAKDCPTTMDTSGCQTVIPGKYCN